MNDFSKETLEKIKKEKVHPRPRWYFLTRDYFFWIMFAITTNLDWDIYQYLGLSLSEAVVKSLPYLWIALIFSVCYILQFYPYTYRLSLSFSSNISY